METIAQTITKKMYVFAYPRPYAPEGEEKFSYEVTDQDMRDCEDWIFIKEFEIEVEIPAGISLLDGQVDSLEASKRKEMAEHEVRMQYLDDKIASLLCIEYTPEDS